MTIEDFAKRVFEERKVVFSKKGLDALDPDFECATRVVSGMKYTKVDVGPAGHWSGKFMIDSNDNIYGIKAYGQINKRRYYGTLKTVDKWFWGEYYPIKREEIRLLLKFAVD